MVNLLSAGFVRLRKSCLFWGFIISEFIWGSFVYYLTYDSVSAFGEEYAITNSSLMLFMPCFYIGVAEAIFCSFFIGVEYSDGTMRNKIIAGCRRKNIFLSNLIITSVAGLAILAAHIFAALTVGLCLVGDIIFTSIDNLPLKLIAAVFIILGNAAFYTLLASSIKSKSVSVVTGILLSFIIIVAGLIVTSTLEKNEFNTVVKFNGNGESVTTQVHNENYIDGEVRTVLELSEAMLPTSSTLRLMHPKEDTSELRIILAQSGTVLIFAAAGILTFEKKDIV